MDQNPLTGHFSRQIIVHFLCVLNQGSRYDNALRRSRHTARHAGTGWSHSVSFLLLLLWSLFCRCGFCWWFIDPTTWCSTSLTSLSWWNEHCREFWLTSKMLFYRNKPAADGPEQAWSTWGLGEMAAGMCCRGPTASRGGGSTRPCSSTREGSLD